MSIKIGGVVHEADAEVMSLIDELRRDRDRAHAALNTRPVIIFKREKIDGKWQTVKEGDAIFHCFSTDHEEYQEGPGLFPVAVVEFSDGSLASRHVDLVRFVEPTQA